MDPLSASGLAAAVVQVTGFAGEVLLKLYRYYLDVNRATLRAAELREEVGLAFSQLNAISAELNTGRNTLSIDASQLYNTLIRFGKLLEKINRRVQPESLQGIKLLKWPFQMEDTAQIISEIERCKSTFTLALNLNQTYLCDEFLYR